jgi:hypothetical protein
VGEEKRILDYSSSEQERGRERLAEDERRQAIENYNESTFGEPHPVASAVSRIAVLTAVVVGLFVMLPSRIAEPVAWVAVLGGAVWEARKGAGRWRESGRDIFSRW